MSSRESTSVPSRSYKIVVVVMTSPRAMGLLLHALIALWCYRDYTQAVASRHRVGDRVERRHLARSGAPCARPSLLAWERDRFETSQPGSHVAIADICPSFTAHMKTHFTLSAAQFAPYTSSSFVADPTFGVQDDKAVRITLEAHGIPLDVDIVLAFGRAAPIKGFERLILALAQLRERVYFVLISVPYVGDDSSQQGYDHLLQQHAIQATHIKAFTWDLPRALCQWPKTKMVVVPSRHETFSNIPLEVALWARENGPAVVASNAGGFVDQIEPGITGFLVDMTSAQRFTQTMRQVSICPRRRTPLCGSGHIDESCRLTTSRSIFRRPSVGFGKGDGGEQSSIRLKGIGTSWGRRTLLGKSVLRGRR